MALHLHRFPPAAAAALLAAAPGPAARAMFQPGAQIDLGKDLGLDVRGTAVLEDGSLLVLDAGKRCAKCAASTVRAQCPHPWKPRLAHCRKLTGGAGAGETWEAGPVCALNPTVAGILGVRGTTVYLNDLVEGVVRIPLARRGGALRPARAQLALGPKHLLDLGVPFGCAPTIALAPDGTLVLAFDEAVALLAPDWDQAGWQPLRWLLGRVPGKPLKPGARPAMVPSVTADGTILVADRTKRLLVRFAPGDRRLSIPARGEAWPDRLRVPTLAAAHGDTLLVSLHDLGSGTAALVGVDAGTAKPLQVAVSIHEAIRFTPQGDLVITDVLQGGLRLVRAGSGPAATAPVEGKARAGAGGGFALPPDAPSTPAQETKASGTEAARGPAPGPGRVPVDKADRLAIARTTLAFTEDKRVDQAFARWAKPLGGAGAATDGPGPAPNLGPFSLSHGGLKAVVRWMLRNADEANHPADMAEWLALGKPPRPRFSFGLYRHARHRGVVLELDDLQAFTGRIRMDDEPGGVRVADELGPAGGVSGYRLERGGRPRYYQGLTVTLGPDLQSLISIQPAGTPGLAPPDLHENPDGVQPSPGTMP